MNKNIRNMLCVLGALVLSFGVWMMNSANDTVFIVGAMMTFVILIPSTLAICAGAQREFSGSRR